MFPTTILHRQGFATAVLLASMLALSPGAQAAPSTHGPKVIVISLWMPSARPAYIDRTDRCSRLLRQYSLGRI
jgi:purine nucleoside permease